MGTPIPHIHLVPRHQRLRVHRASSRKLFSVLSKALHIEQVCFVQLPSIPPYHHWLLSLDVRRWTLGGHWQFEFTERPLVIKRVENLDEVNWDPSGVIVPSEAVNFVYFKAATKCIYGSQNSTHFLAFLISCVKFLAISDIQRLFLDKVYPGEDI